MQHAPVFPFEYWKSAERGRTISRPLLYALQHLVLPHATLHGHPMLHQALSERVLSKFGFEHMVALSSLQCEGANGWPADVSEYDPYYEYRDQLLQYVVAERYVRSTSTNWVIRMPPPLASPEAHFVSIWNFAPVTATDLVHGKPRYFTLELSDEPGNYFICEWGSDGNHRNHTESRLLTSDQFDLKVAALAASE